MASILTYTATPSVDVGRLLREAREEAGLTQDEMARYTGWTVRQVKHWEAGESPIKRGIVVAWAVATKRDPDELVSDIARASGCISDEYQHPRLFHLPDDLAA